MELFLLAILSYLKILTPILQICKSTQFNGILLPYSITSIRRFHGIKNINSTIPLRPGENRIGKSRIANSNRCILVRIGWGFRIGELCWCKLQNWRIEIELSLSKKSPKIPSKTDFYHIKNQKTRKFNYGKVQKSRNP